VTALLFAAFVASADPVVVRLGTLSATVPADWKSEKPANLLRSHQFRLASGEPNVPDAEVAVYKEGSPKVEAKLAEWKGTFVPPDGKTLDDIAKTAKWDLPGATAHVLDVSGTWRFRERPKDPKSKEEIRPEYRAVWVIVLQGEDAVHVRFSGPEKVVAKHYPAFEKWARSAK
jgi:hypothetical protein